MHFELTKDFIIYLKSLIEIQDVEKILDCFSDAHPADIADILEQLTNEEANYVFIQFPPSLEANILVELEDEQLDHFLQVIPAEIIATDLIEKMDSDDAADILQTLPERIKTEVLAKMSDKEQASDIADLLDYDENTAGGLMATELVRVNKNWNVQKCIVEIRKQAEEVDNLMNVYVVDDNDVFVGLLPIARLVLVGEGALVSDLYDHDALSVPTNMPSEEVAGIMEKYDLFVIPVVDSLNRLKGRITIDDVVDVIKEEAERDFQMQAGLTQDVDESDSFARHTFARLPWLFIGLLGGILSSRVIGVFQGDIAKNTSLTLFLPLLAAMGGNVGVQSSSIIVQSIASGTLMLTSVGKRILRELAGGLLIGIICSTVLFAYNWLFCNDLHLTFVVSLSLIIIIVFASLFGTFVPVVLEKFKIDPAIATGPFVTTTNDIVCCLLYFSIARILI